MKHNKEVLTAGHPDNGLWRQKSHTGPRQDLARRLRPEVDPHSSSYKVKKLIVDTMVWDLLRETRQGSSALCVRLNGKWEIGIFTEMSTSPLIFSMNFYFRSNIFGDCPLFSFTFDTYVGTS